MGQVALVHEHRELRVGATQVQVGAKPTQEAHALSVNGGPVIGQRVSTIPLEEARWYHDFAYAAPSSFW